MQFHPNLFFNRYYTAQYPSGYREVLVLKYFLQWTYPQSTRFVKLQFILWRKFIKYNLISQENKLFFA